MPIGSSMSVAADGNKHLVTVRVWFVPQPGSNSEQVDVVVDWAPQVLAIDAGTVPNPDPVATFAGSATGIVLWANQAITLAANPAATPKEFKVVLSCLMRASTSVEASIGIVGTRTPHIYTGAVLCP